MTPHARHHHVPRRLRRGARALDGGSAGEARRGASRMRCSGLASWRQAHGMEGGEPAPTPISWPSTSPRTARSSWAGGCTAAGPGRGTTIPTQAAGGAMTRRLPAPLRADAPSAREPRDAGRDGASTSSPTGSIRRSTGTTGLPETRPSMWRVDPTSPAGADAGRSRRAHGAHRARAAGLGHAALRQRRRKPWKLEPLPMPASPTVTHLRYRVVR